MNESIFALVLLLGAAGTGGMALRRLGVSGFNASEELSLSVGVGFGGLMLAVLALGLLHGMDPMAIWITVLVWLALGLPHLGRLFGKVRSGVAEIHARWSAPHTWLWGATGAILLLSLVRALAPPHGSTDPLAYHLALPKLYLFRGRLSFEQTINGALYPANMEMLYAVGLALRNGVLAQLLHWMLGVTCLVGIAGFARRYAGKGAAPWAAAVFASVPLVVVFAAQGYVDIALGCYQFLAFAMVFRFLESPDRRVLILAGVLAGIALGIKHQGLATLAVAVPMIAGGGVVRGRRLTTALADAALFTALAVVLVAPWYIRAYLAAGNPVWPLANSFFHGMAFGAQPVILSGNSSQAGLLSTLVPSWAWVKVHWVSMSPWAWAFLKQGPQKWTGVYFVALLPGVVLLRNRRAWVLLGFCLFYYLTLVRFLHMNPRYGVVLLAFASVLAGWVADHLAGSGVRPVRWAFTGLFLATMVLNILWVYNFNRPLVAVAFGSESRTHFLRRMEPEYTIFERANETLPADAKILLQGIVRGYYCERDYLWDHPYQSLIDYSQMSDPEDLRRRFAQLGITHVIRMIRIPPGRVALGYPQYFLNEFQEAFRTRHLRLLARTAGYVLFEVE